MMTTTFADHYVRTDAGKAEIRAQTIKMSRPARNLLMVIDNRLMEAVCPMS